MRMTFLLPLFKNSLILLLAFFCSAFTYPSLVNPVTSTGMDSVEIKVSTFNIRYNAQADIDSGNGWSLRKQPVANLIKTHGFEIVGTQEGDRDQMADLQGLLPTFGMISYPYGGANGDLHTCGILYKKDRFELLEQGVFWLSQTPDEPSLGWDATDRRICTWAKFKEKKSGKTFFYFNAHFYWRLQEAKRESGPLIVRKIKEIAADSPSICVGDFNSTSQTPQIAALKVLLNDSFDVSKGVKKGPEDTNLGGGNFLGPAKGRIDYIFLSKFIAVQDYEVYPNQYNGNRYPSDHFPVSCTIKF